MNKPRIGLVLGGGGSRGLAHIGVLQVLERESCTVDCIVGTSMGAIIGALYALGVSPQRMAERAEEIKIGNVFNINLFSAHARQRMVEAYLEQIIGHKTFDDLKIPLVVMAVDMLHGHEIAIQSGPLIPALLATSAVPAVFPPVEHMGLQLADGGVIDSVATHAAYEQGAERIIAVDVYPPLDKDNPWVDPVSAIMGFQLPFGLFSGASNKSPGMLSSIWRGFRVMAWHLHEERLKQHPPHVLLRPEVKDYGSLDFKDTNGPIIAGREEAERKLPHIKALYAVAT